MKKTHDFIAWVCSISGLSLLDLGSSQWCCCRSRCSGTWCCALGV